MKKLETLYHFTGKTLRDGSPIPPIGKWLVHKGKLRMCESGLHCSPTAFEALQYAPGALLHQVVVGGEIIKDKDKWVVSKRKIIASIDATNMLRKFSRSVALDAMHLWKPPDVVVQYLTTGKESIRDAAWVAAWDATESAAMDAARAAARAAAMDAARAAARDAAWEAARVAAREAAWAAAMDAARAAAWEAARAAAWDATESAAMDAARAKYASRFNAMAEGEFLK